MAAPAVATPLAGGGSSGSSLGPWQSRALQGFARRAESCRALLGELRPSSEAVAAAAYRTPREAAATPRSARRNGAAEVSRSSSGARTERAWACRGSRGLAAQRLAKQVQLCAHLDKPEQKQVVAHSAGPDRKLSARSRDRDREGPSLIKDTKAPLDDQKEHMDQARALEERERALAERERQVAEQQRSMEQSAEELRHAERSLQALLEHERTAASAATEFQELRHHASETGLSSWSGGGGSRLSGTKARLLGGGGGGQQPLWSGGRPLARAVSGARAGTGSAGSSRPGSASASGRRRARGAARRRSGGSPGTDFARVPQALRAYAAQAALAPSSRPGPGRAALPRRCRAAPCSLEPPGRRGGGGGGGEWPRAGSPPRAAPLVADDDSADPADENLADADLAAAAADASSQPPSPFAGRRRPPLGGAGPRAAGGGPAAAAASCGAAAGGWEEDDGGTPQGSTPRGGGTPEGGRCAMPPPPPGLASHISQFAPPAPGAGSVAAAMLAEAREELGALAEAAECAAASCLESAPLAEALRSTVLRELAELEEFAAHAFVDSGEGDPGACLPRRITELRDAAAQGLLMLQGAMRHGASPPAAAAAGEGATRHGASPPGAAGAGEAAAARMRVPPPPAPLPTFAAAAALSPGASRSAPTSPASPTAAGGSTSPACSPSPQLATALGDVAADMRQALTEIRARRSGPTAPTAAAELPTSSLWQPPPPPQLFR